MTGINKDEHRRASINFRNKTCSNYVIEERIRFQIDSVNIIHFANGMDLLYKALDQFRKRNYENCADICTNILEKHPLDQAAWCLKMRSLTQRVYIDDLESEGTIESDSLDENAVASAPRPGTSIVNMEKTRGTMR